MGLVRRGHAVEGEGSGETVPPQFFSFNSTTAATTLIFIPQRQNNRATAPRKAFPSSISLSSYVHTCMSGTRPAARPYGL